MVNERRLLGKEAFILGRFSLYLGRIQVKDHSGAGMSFRLLKHPQLQRMWDCPRGEK